MDPISWTLAGKFIAGAVVASILPGLLGSGAAKLKKKITGSGGASAVAWGAAATAGVAAAQIGAGWFDPGAGMTGAIVAKTASDWLWHWQKDNR